MVHHFSVEGLSATGQTEITNENGDSATLNGIYTLQILGTWGTSSAAKIQSKVKGSASFGDILGLTFTEDVVTNIQLHGGAQIDLTVTGTTDLDVYLDKIG